MTEGAWLLFLLTTLSTPTGPAIEITATRHASEARCEQEKKKVVRPNVAAGCERERRAVRQEAIHERQPNP